MLTNAVARTSLYARALLSEIVVLVLDSAEQLLVIVSFLSWETLVDTLTSIGTAGCQSAFGTCTSTDVSPDGTCKSTT
jgi:hypothetical protein